MEWLLIALALLLIAACGMFVAAEFALITVGKPTLEASAATGDRRSQGGLSALRSLSTQLSGAQLGITVTNLAIGFLAEPSIANLVDGPLEGLGLGSGAATAVSVTLALVLSTALTMVFGELVPKNLAIAKPLETVRFVQGFQRGFTKATAYPIRFFNGTANRILHLFGFEPQEELASARSPQELVSLVARSAEKGTLEQSTATLVTRTLAFGDRRADDVMTPRVRLQTIEPGQSANAVYALANTTGHSRFPVVPQGVDQVVGIVHVKHVVAVDPAERDTVTVADLMVAKPPLVPSTLELDDLLTLLRDNSVHMAVVIDEFGGVDGVVTVEDLIEELVGEVVDEHDNADSSVRKLDGGGLDLSGLLRPDEASTALGVELPGNEDYETLAGLLTYHLEHMPNEGDTVELAVERPGGSSVAVTLVVAEMHGLRVDRVHARTAELADEQTTPERATGTTEES